MINAEIEVFQVSTLVPDLSGFPYVAPLRRLTKSYGTSAQIPRQKLRHIISVTGLMWLCCL